MTLRAIYFQAILLRDPVYQLLFAFGPLKAQNCTVPKVLEKLKSFQPKMFIFRRYLPLAVLVLVSRVAPVCGDPVSRLVRSQHLASSYGRLRIPDLKINLQSTAPTNHSPRPGHVTPASQSGPSIRVS